MNKLKFKYGNGCFEFEVEGDDEFVKEKTEWATSLVSQSQNRLNELQPTSSQDQINYVVKSDDKNYNSPVQFLLEKNFLSEIDVTLALAYYLERYEGKTSWNITDLQNEYSLSRRKLPSNLSRNISGNISKGYIINPNREEKRVYCLTPEGEMYIENFTSKEKNNSSKPKTKKATSIKPSDPEELEKIEQVKQDIDKYDENLIELLEKVKGQKEHTLLSANLIYLKFGAEYEFTPKIISQLLKKLGISLDSVQAIKVISANSKFFDSKRRGWYLLNEVGIKYIRQNIILA